MNVPLDNLYDWIANQFDDDCIIYQFYPHGSKNIRDLIQARDYDYDFEEFSKKIPVVCHDQEPLHYDLYSDINWRSIKEHLTDKNWPRHLIPDEKYWKHMASRNIFSAIPTNTFDRYLLLHSEQRSDQIIKYSSHAVDAYWWSHAMISRDWYRFAQIDTRLRSRDRYDFDFNIYARDCTGTRQYRKVFLDLIRHSPSLAAASRITDPLSQTSSDSSATYDHLHYKICGIDVVLETLFDDKRLHLTEKTLRPIACGKPFILGATTQSLEYLRSYGFKTFSGLINESYDLIDDPLQRTLAIVSELDRIEKLTHDKKQNLYYHLHEIADYNKNYFFSDSFAKLISEELRTNITTAIYKIKTNYQTGRNYRLQRKMMPLELKRHLKKVDPDHARQRIECLKRVRKHRAINNTVPGIA